MLQLSVTLGLGHLFDAVRRLLNRPPGQGSAAGPLHLRLTLERLGGTFVKFGQLLAMRPDLVPQSYISELSRLLDKVPPFDGDEAARTVERELNRPLSELFEDFNLKPVAAASFAQVHRARLKSGDMVAVKVQRPGIERTVELDLSYLDRVTRFIDFSGIMKRVRLRPFAEDFIHWTREELDYQNEGVYAERMRRSRVRIKTEYVPKVYWSHTSRRVLTTEFLQGMWMSDLIEVIETGDERRLRDFEAEGHDLRRIARNLFFNTLEQAFHRTMIHADPHAGNLVVLDDDRIGYVDLGIMGQLDAEFRSTQLNILQAMGEEDYDHYFRSLMRFLYPLPEIIDINALRTDIINDARKWANSFFNPHSSLEERGTGRLLTLALLTARRFGLSFSLLALRYYRAVVAVEMIIFRLDPDFDYRDAIKRFTYRLQVKLLQEGDTPSNAFKTWLQLQLWRQNLPTLIDRYASELEYDRESIWAAVSGPRMFAYRVFYWLAVLCLLALLGGGVLWLLPPYLYKNVLHLNWTFLAGAAAGLPLFGWLARFFYRSAIRRTRTAQRL